MNSRLQVDEMELQLKLHDKKLQKFVKKRESYEQKWMQGQEKVR